MARIVFLLIFVMGISAVCFAQVAPPLSQIERSQELINEEEALRKRIEAPEKIYIEEIIVEGATLLAEKEIKDLVLPYEKKWLTKDDIRQIINEFKEAYRSKGCAEQLPEIAYQIKDKRLIIEVKELKSK